jgi:hypothetical protein
MNNYFKYVGTYCDECGGQIVRDEKDCYCLKCGLVHRLMHDGQYFGLHPTKKTVDEGCSLLEWVMHYFFKKEKVKG